MMCSCPPRREQAVRSTFFRSGNLGMRTPLLGHHNDAPRGKLTVFYQCWESFGLLILLSSHQAAGVAHQVCYGGDA